MPRSQSRNGEAFTQFGWLVCLWILLIPFQYGYHTSVLNQIQAVVTCKNVTTPDSQRYSYGLPTCLPMSDFTFSVVTAVFTVGGLAGSLMANLIMERWGRRDAARLSALLVAIGAGLMTVAASVSILGLGRLLVGVGSGVGLCVGPIYLSEIAPTKISENVGVLTQLAIVLGIMVTQAIGLLFATPTQWRSVLFMSAAGSVAQFFLSGVVVESPAWLGGKGQVEPRKAVARKLWGTVPLGLISSSETQLSCFAAAADASIEDPLLDELEAHRDESVTALTVPQVLAARELRKPLAIVCFAMLSPQLSGINAVLYYSNDILSKSLPEFGPYVSLGITIVNVLMTFPPIFLIKRLGGRQLLTLSGLGAISSLILVGLGLNTGTVTLSSVAILTFVTSFATGLGPVPFVMIPEVSPYQAVSALSSIALSLNWTANFLVGLVFLPLRNFLSDGEATKEGRVFYLFAVALFASMFSLSRIAKFGADADTESDYDSAPASPTPNLNPSSSTAVDILMADLNTDPSSGNSADEDTCVYLGNVEDTLLCLTSLVENLSNTAPHTAPVFGVPPPDGSSGLFADVHPAAKSSFLHAVRTYAQLIPEALVEGGPGRPYL
ncbi:hypothetical protein K438DRAFT_2015984 [Mycena galopus ATCC 62051]|nr:hypothetical protein K438DRAFT_2015984 [Mycena galopus ATCC 62051]